MQGRPSSPASGRTPIEQLAPVGPVGMLDRALSLARDGGLPVLGPAWGGGAVVAAVVLGLYYVERVEGVRSLRPMFALALALAWWARAWLLGRSARRVTARLRETSIAPEAGRPVDVLRTALVAGAGMWMWSWLLVAGSLGGAIGVVLVLPLLSLRGAIAPSWIARAACTAQAGVRGFARAAGDTRDRRGAGVLTEAMVLAGAVGLAVNLYALTFVAVLLARSFVGIEVTAVESFLSPTNTFVQLAIGAAALVLLEPLRASLSAVGYVDARVRAEGLDLRALVDAAVRHSTERRADRRKGAQAAAAVILFACLGVTARGHAQAPAPAFPPPPPPPSSDDAAEVPDAADRGDDPTWSFSPSDPPFDAAGDPMGDRAPTEPGAMPFIETEPRDRAVQQRVDGILGRPEFREFEDHRGEGARDLVERLLRWLFRSPDALPTFERPSVGSLSLPGPWFFLAIGAALLLGIGLYLYVSRRRDRDDVRRVENAAASATDLRDRPPASFLDEAARLAEGGDLREALRALYLATLVALDRRRLIAFDPHRTNWQYLRQMPAGAARDAFRQFTGLFDHKWYGREDTTRHDYERCRALASEIVAEGDAA